MSERVAGFSVDAGRECARPHRRGGKLSRCWSRDFATCRSCAALDALYTKKLLSSGIVGYGSDYNFFLVTLTAPSFGRVHSVPHSATDKLRQCGCGKYHEFGSPVAGVALDLDRYRYKSAVEWNHNSTELFHRSWERFVRSMAGSDYSAIREFQNRGLIHLHIIVRVPKGFEVLEVFPKLEALRTHKVGGFAWGKAMDVQLLQTDAGENAVRYLSKVVGYTTKTLGKSRVLLSDEQREFFGRLDAASVRLGYSARDVRGFGYGGHVLTRSKGWSDLSKKQLRDEAREYAEAMSDDTDELRGAIVSANADELRELADELGNSESYDVAPDSPDEVRARLFGVPRRRSVGQPVEIVDDLVLDDFGVFDWDFADRSVDAHVTHDVAF